ncbi:MFS transporter [Gordoniibacillus kamchatkensis]|uniref:MFS transporter n=1 Tax=Gordoniibacillus kamchatkensis TaxID=1590651 RepID=A0ABR5AMG7_9BACL|nr:MFS transporter [Paenibacillus sp. VKM B-2647]KIL42155.1 MFS transporter [Paenibacillus sp. VKM B-2647]
MNRLLVYMIALGCFVVGTVELVVAGILNSIANDLHISIALAGQLITAYSLAFAIGTPLLVAVTARMGRKSVLAGSLAVFVAGCLVSFGSPQYAVLLGSRVILGLSAGVFSVVAIGSVAKLVPADKMGGAISTIALAFGSALTFGVPLGIAIAGWWGWRGIFAVLAAVGLLIMLGMIRLLPHIEGDAPASLRQRFAVVGNPVIVSGLFLSFFMNMSNSVMLTYLTPFLQTIFHLNVSDVGLMMLVLGVSGMIGSRFGGFGTDRWGAARMISLGLTISAATVAIVPAFAAVPFAGLAIIALWMFSLFMTAPALQTYFIQQAPQSSNFVLGVNTSIIHLGIAAGAGAGGLVADATSTVLHNSWIAGCTYVLGLGLAGVSFSLRKKIRFDAKREVKFGNG